MSFNYEEVKKAYERIQPYIRKTPLEESFYLGDEKRNYYFKLESFQRAKSFKIRGALNKMMTLTEEERSKGIATISSGNHGSSVSYAASLLGIQNAKVIVPDEQMRNFIAIAGTSEERILYLPYSEVDLAPGDRVRITGGTCEGVEGIYQRIKGVRDKQVVVCIEGLVAVATATVPAYLVEKI